MLTSFVVPYFLKLSCAIITVMLISTHCVFAKYADKCVTAENETGICLPVKSCAKIYAMIRNLQNLDSEAYNNTVHVLKQSQCYYENDMPHVCCPKSEIQINPDIYVHLSQLNCGSSSNRKISHGEVADIYAFRWSALLVYDGSNKFRCGGSLISERYVLTAAHCFLNLKEMPIAVRLGEYDLSTEVDCVKIRKIQKCAEYEDVAIEKTFIPENYVQRGLHHDIALLRLARAVQFKKNISPICLPISTELQTKHIDWYLVAGWGRTENGNTSNVLLYTSIPYRPREFCQQNLRIPKKENLTIGHICAGGENFHDSCKGDSGGAIFLPDIYTDGVVRNIQFGIVSLGVPSCGEMTAPAIYTNVSHYMQWITDHMSLN